MLIRHFSWLISLVIFYLKKHICTHNSHMTRELLIYQQEINMIMGQSLLIDVNTGFIKHRLTVLGGLLTGNTEAVEGSLNAMNALLPEKYRVVIDTDEYNHRISGSMVALCSHCKTAKEVDDGEGKPKIVKLPTPIDYNNIKILTLLLSSREQFLTGQKYDKFWICPKCGKDNRLSTTEFEQTTLREPHFLQVVPAPPTKKVGLTDRMTFQVKFERWARKLEAELEASAARFRAEYKPRKGENLDGIMIDTEGEGDD